MKILRTSFIAAAIILSLLSATLYILNSKPQCPPGQNVCHDPDAKRFISLSPNITEILFALGLEEETVGVTSYCNFPPQAKLKTSVGSIMQPDFETILSLHPTTVFSTGSTLHKSFVTRLKNIDCQAVAIRIENIDQLYTAIKDIAQTADIPTRGDQLCKNIQNQLSLISAQSKYPTKPKVLVVIQREPLIVAGRDTLIDELINIAGGENAIAQTTSVFPRISSEELLLCNPDIIIETSADSESETALTQFKSFFNVWPQISAVQNDNLFMIEPDTISRPGPRIVEAAKTLHNIINACMINAVEK